MKSLSTLVFLAMIAAVALVPAAQAQPQESAPESYESDVFWQLATKQVVESLDSEYLHIRSQTLKNSIVFSTLYRDRVDLSAAVDAIARVAELDESSENRTLALAALQAIGSFRAKQHLAELEGIDDDEYRLLVATVITEYQLKPNAL